MIKENLFPVIIQLISRAVSGNVVDSLMKDKSLGSIGNSTAGTIGGKQGS